MDEYDADPLPPRSSYRPPAPQHRTSRSSSVSSSVSAESTTRSSQPWLLKRRVLSLEAFESELRRGDAAKEELVREYGKPVPIPVPLKESERKESYEQRFIKWLRDERRLTLAQLVDDGNRERMLRTVFAKLQLKGYSSNGQPDLGALVSKRGRSDDSYESQDGYDRKGVKRPCDETPLPAARRLLHKRVIPFEQFKEEQERYGGRQLTEAERIALYGSTTVPINVPLFEGETYQDYERDFERFLKTVSMDLSRLPKEPNTERSLRLLFARTRLMNESRRPIVPASSAAMTRRTSHSSSISPTRRPEATEDTLSGRFTEAKNRVSSSEQAAPPSTIAPVSNSRNVTAHPELSQPFQFPASCSVGEPSARQAANIHAQDLLNCGCRQCLVQCTSRLISQVAVLEERIASISTTAASEEKQVMDLTKDGEAMSTECGSTKRLDVARMLHITALVRQRWQRSQPQPNEVTSDVEDPIEHQLLSQYNEINERVITNQRALELAASQLQDAPFEPMQETSHSQLENPELQAMIDEEMGHRNAALAMLLVYMSRHQPHELEQRLQAHGAADIPHVQRMCHQKTATVASDMAAKKVEASELTSLLDAVLNEPAPVEYDADSDMQRLTRLQELGVKLTRVEAEVRMLVASRRREFSTLLHFDAHVRQLVAAFMQKT